MPKHDDILLTILTDRLRLLIQIHDDEQPGMRSKLLEIDRALFAYRTGLETLTRTVAALELQP